MKRRGIVLLACLLAAGFVASPSAAEAARGRKSPYLKTPFGLIPKSVYNAPYVRNPQKLEQYRQAEQKRMQGTGNATASTKKTTKQ